MRFIPLFVSLVAAQCISFATTIHFDEFGSAPLIDANGLSTQGVTFGFAPGQAVYNNTVGTAGNVLLSMDPVLSGPTTGILTLTFQDATPLLQFDILLLSLAPIDDSMMGLNGGPAYTVLLSNAMGFQTSFSGSTVPLLGGGYSEGQFSYSGTAINTATITFFHGVDANDMPVTQFGVDNLTFVTPEPASFLGLGAGLLVIGVIKRRQRGYSRDG